ncbi:MAG: 50S ribosomal protein L25/general stress protein Ctc [Proteobacteria bacterium]|nr:50S ribosomal protein L25/general stress protein Ctc [Pseudomonadota bacterium]
MAQIHELAASGRTDQGKGASRRLRRAGQVPAVVYGAGETPQNIQFEHNTLALAARNEWFTSSILDLLIDGKRQKVLLRDVQKHPFKPQLLHLDFLRINENQAVRVRVPLHFVNQEKSPAGKASGVVVSHAMTDMEVSCLPKDLPEFLEVDLVELKLGDIVHMSDIRLPDGVEIPELRLGKEHDHPVVTAQEIREEVEQTPEGAEGAAPAEAAAAAAPAEPAPAKKEEK